MVRHQQDITWQVIVNHAQEKLIANREVAVDQIKALHVYDFDNTCTLLPSPRRFTPKLILLSIQDSPTQSSTLEWPHDRHALQPRRLRQRRLVAR